MIALMHLLRDLDRRHTLAGVFGLVAFLITAVLGFWAASADPPNLASSASLVVLAGVFQVLAASFVHAVGKADPALARQAVKHLIRMGKRAADAEADIQNALETGTPTEIKAAAGYASRDLSYLEEGALAAIDTWAEVHELALRPVLEEDEDG